MYRSLHPAPHTSLNSNETVPLIVLCTILGFAVTMILIEITAREMTWLGPILKDLGERRVGWCVFVFCMNYIILVICIAPVIVPLAMVIWVMAKY